MTSMPEEPPPAAAIEPIGPPAGMTGEPGPFLRLVRDQRIAFVIVGGVNTLVGFALFALFDLTVGRLVDESINRVAGSLATLMCAHVVSVLFAFVMYRRFVFKVRGHVWRDLGAFEAVYLVAIVINAIVLPLLVQLGWHRLLAQASILLVTTLISYFGHRNVSFRRRPVEDE